MTRVRKLAGIESLSDQASAQDEARSTITSRPSKGVSQPSRTTFLCFSVRASPPSTSARLSPSRSPNREKTKSNAGGIAAPYSTEYPVLRHSWQGSAPPLHLLFRPHAPI